MTIDLALAVGFIFGVLFHAIFVVFDDLHDYFKLKSKKLRQEAAE